jgi:hypothetical protein
MKKLVLIALLLCSAGLFAQSKTPVVDQREKNQQARIKEGVQTGEVTRGEARRLEAQQGKIKADEMVAKSDGKVTNAERRQLKREQNRASKNIYRKKHNGVTRKP